MLKILGWRDTRSRNTQSKKGKRTSTTERGGWREREREGGVRAREGKTVRWRGRGRERAGRGDGER